MLTVTILGCGGSAGVPQIGGADGRGDWGACDPAEPRNRRTRSSIVIEGEGRRLLVDTGPDLREQLLACAVPRVDAILYTHAHADHIAGLDDVRILNRLLAQPIDVYATQGVLDDLASRFEYAFRPWSPPGFFRPVVVGRPIEPGQTVEILGLPVQILDQDHGFIHTLGLRVGGFGYSTDVAILDDAVLDALQGLDTWVVDCFQRRAHKTHANIEQVIAWAERIKPRRTVLTHMGYDLDWRWLVNRLPPGIEPGHDGLVLEIG